MTAFVNATELHMGDFSARTLASQAEVFALAGLSNAQFFMRLARMAERRAGNFDVLNLASTA